MPKTDIHGPGVDAAREARHKLADLEVVRGPTISPVSSRWPRRVRLRSCNIRGMTPRLAECVFVASRLRRGSPHSPCTALAAVNGSSYKSRRLHVMSHPIPRARPGDPSDFVTANATENAHTGRFHLLNIIRRLRKGRKSSYVVQPRKRRNEDENARSSHICKIKAARTAICSCIFG